MIADDPTTPGGIEARQVLDTFVRETDALVDLYVDGEVISTTGEHPFWVPDKGWVEAKDLTVGSLLQTEDGIIVDVDRVEKREGPFEVYNFNVEGIPTYFVSELGILVHNVCDPEDFGNAREPLGGIKDFEKNPDGTTIRNPKLQILTPGQQALPLEQGKKYIWAVDESGNLRIGEEEKVGPKQFLGHPTLVDNGTARVAGEIKFNPETKQWRINDTSGRYSRGRSPEVRNQILDNVQKLFNDAGLKVGVKYN